MTRYRCVDSQKAEGFPVTAACAAAGVSTSGYYDWANRQDRPPTPAEVDEAALVERIKALFDASDGTYGVPRMCRALRNEDLNVNRKRVTRLMRRHGLAGRAFRRRVRTTIPAGEEFFIPDLVGRAFAPGPTDAAWCQAPISRPVKAGCTWRRCSTSGRAGWSATRWPTTCAPNWSPTR